MSLINLFDKLRERVEIAAQQHALPVEVFLSRFLDQPIELAPVWKPFVEYSPSACMVVTADADFSLVAYNDSFVQLLSVAPNELVGASLMGLKALDGATQLHKHFQDVAVSGECEAITVQLHMPSSQQRWFKFESRLVTQPISSLTFILTNVYDMTIETETQAEIVREQERYQQLTELMTDYAFSIEVMEDGRLVNDWLVGAFHQMTGVAKPSFNSLVDLAMVVPDDRPQLEQDLNQIVQHNKRMTSEYRIQHKDGHIIWLRVTRQPVWDEQQKRVVRFYGAAKDITYQAESKIQLQRSEERFRIMNELSSDYSFSFDVLPDKSLRREWNTSAAFKRMTGYTAEEMDILGGWSILVHPDDKVHMAEYVDDLLERPQAKTIHYRVITKDGEIRYIKGYDRSIANQHGQVVKTIGTAHDITEQVLVQRELAESEERFRTLANQAPIFIWMDDEDGQCIYFNQTWLDFTGQTLADSLGEGWKVKLHPQDRDSVRFVYNMAVTQTDPYEYEYRLQRHDGEYRWMRSHGLPRFSGDGAFIGYIGATIDVTDIFNTQQALERLVTEQTEHLKTEIAQRREIERELKREHDLLEKVIRTSPSAILRVGIDGQVLFASERAAQIFDTTMSHILASSMQTAYGLLYELDGSPLAYPTILFEEVLTTGEPSYGRELMLIRDDDKRYILSLNVAPLYDDGGSVSEIIITVEDVTLRKQVEASMAAALEQERKVNAMRRQFTSLVTHEFKGPLTVIQISCDILRRKHGRLTDEQFLQRIGRIEEQGVRLTQLVSDILHLHQVEGGQYALQRTTFNLYDLIHHIAEEVQIAYDDMVEVLLSLEGPELVLLDETMMRKMLSNLLGNAVKYSEAGHVVNLVYQQTDEQLIFTVQDYGVGIPEKDQQYLFSDFFRASNVGQRPGTGLGLVIVKQAVDLHGGEISVTSAENEGSKFTVTLPHWLTSGGS